MPMHKVTVEVECDHPEFTSEEAREWLHEHLSTGTDPRIGRMAKLVATGQFLTDDDTAVPVRWVV